MIAWMSNAKMEAFAVTWLMIMNVSVCLEVVMKENIVKKVSENRNRAGLALPVLYHLKIY